MAFLSMAKLALDARSPSYACDALSIKNWIDYAAGPARNHHHCAERHRRRDDLLFV
jgi:hypothetical protein